MNLNCGVSAPSPHPSSLCLAVGAPETATQLVFGASLVCCPLAAFANSIIVESLASHSSVSS